LNKYKTIQLLIFSSFFPVWVVRSDLTFSEILFVIIGLLVIPFFITCTILTKKNYSKNYSLYLISLIFIYGVDNHLGLRNGIDALIHSIYNLEDFFDHGFGKYKYFAGIIILFTLSFIFFILIKITDFKFINIILIFTLTIGLFNFFDNSKSYKQFINFEKAPNIKNFKKTTLVLVFDAFSGINTYESKNFNGDKFIKISDNFFKKYNFHVYDNARSISTQTSTSFANFTNLTSDIKYYKKYREYRDSLNNGGYYLRSNNYFQNWKLVKNIFFEKFNQVSVFQGMAINFCEVGTIFKCDTYNPFKQRNFIDGFKNTKLSRIASINQMNGSIIGHTIWGVLLQLRFIDSMAMPEGEKPAFLETLKKVKYDIYSQKYDLIFLHTINPHLPFGYTSKCKYDGSLSFNTSYMNEEEKGLIYNNERICIINFLDKFLSDIKKNKKLENLDIIILSDHGSKAIEGTDALSALLAYRNATSKYYRDDAKITIQDFFKISFGK
tara:strand:+ start:707 stop:2191 length:1485 start_codon:yes stop_codon:yes gene_type:complete